MFSRIYQGEQGGLWSCSRFGMFIALRLCVSSKGD